ncbi:MAG: TonB family protein [Fibrobacter sp.]|nr:TonB family protein [Fibrobacter sp.]
MKVFFYIACSFCVLLTACNEEKEKFSRNSSEVFAKHAYRVIGSVPAPLQTAPQQTAQTIQLSKHEYRSRRCSNVTDKELAIHLGCCTGNDAAIFSDYCAGAPAVKASGSVQKLSESDIEMEGDDVRNKADVLKVAQQRRPGIRHIYNKYLKKKPGFAGVVKMKFTIAPNGEIVSISMASSTTGFDEFDSEIKNNVSRWRFTQVESGSTTVTIPFIFSESSPEK